MKKKEQRRWRNRGIVVMALALALTGSYHYIASYVTVSNNVNGRELPISSVETEKKAVALTFEAAWSNEDTDEILEILKEHGVRATFFVTGEWVEKYPDTVKLIYEAGHDLGNHSEHHKNMIPLTDEEQTAEVLSVHEKVKTLTGQRMELFRLPYDSYDDRVILNAEENGYYTIAGDVDSQDWKDYGAGNIVDTVLNHESLQKGAIIRLHVGTEHTAEALDDLLCGLKERGYQVLPVSELIYKDQYHLDVRGRQIRD